MPALEYISDITIETVQCVVTLNGVGVIRWFYDHKDHNVVIKDEYGRVI